MEALIPIAIQLVPEIGRLLFGSAASSWLDKVGTIAEKIFGSKDPAIIQAQMTADQAKADLFKAILGALAQSDAAQNEVNKVEAQNPSLFVAGWRPFIGWVCGLGLCYQFLLWPFLTWLANVMHAAVPPQLDGNSLMSLLTGMLGLSASRSYEKLQGTETKAIATAPFKLPSLASLKGGK